MAWLLMVKKLEDMFIPFDRMYERDRQTDDERALDDIGRAYASHRAAKSITVHNRSVSLVAHNAGLVMVVGR